MHHEPREKSSIFLHNIIFKTNHTRSTNKVPLKTSIIFLKAFKRASNARTTIGASIMCLTLISATQLLIILNSLEPVQASRENSFKKIQQSQSISSTNLNSLSPNQSIVSPSPSSLADNQSNSYSSFLELLLLMSNQSAMNDNPAILNSSQISCENFGRIFNRKQLDLCLRHVDLLHLLLTQTIKKSTHHCQRLFANLKWHCDSLVGFLDRSNPLSSTKEASFVRALINAAAAHIVTEACSSGEYPSCGCLKSASDNGQQHQKTVTSRSAISAKNAQKEAPSWISSLGDRELNLANSYHKFVNVASLDSGIPISLHKRTNDLPGCNHNIAFGAAFARIFLDIDDVKLLNKASKILNQNYPTNAGSKRSARLKDHADIDHIELAFLRWTKAAVNLHNNNLGRKIYQDTTKEKCVCHGISASCQFRTCWKHVGNFETIAHRLYMRYLLGSARVYAHNMATFEQPDLYLVKREPFVHAGTNEANPTFIADNSLFGSGKKILEDIQSQTRENNNNLLQQYEYEENLASANVNLPQTNTKVVDINERVPKSSVSNISDDQLAKGKISVYDLIYLSESPDFCLPINSISHPGTKGRSCLPGDSHRSSSGVQSSTHKRHLHDEHHLDRSSRDITPDESSVADAVNDANQAEDEIRSRDADYNSVSGGQAMLSMYFEGHGRLGKCEDLCCDRGHERELELYYVSCNCKFNFCCRLTCERCLKQEQHYRCL